MICVRSAAPTRVDLAGGTLDLWPIHHLLDRKATVNFGVTLEAKVEIRSRDDDRFEIMSLDQGITVEGSLQDVVFTTDLPLVGLLLKAIWPSNAPGLSISTAATSPAGAGLGGSSCLGIAVAAALLKVKEIWERNKSEPTLERPKSDEDLVRLVQDVEARLIKTPTGCQDYWGGLRGRVNIISFPFGEVQVETLPHHIVSNLNDQLLLCYSGRSRASAINNWEIFKRIFDGDAKLLDVFQEIGALSEECSIAIRCGLLEKALKLSHQEWELRTKLWPSIETAETKKLDQVARSRGALFSRVCGAGGGGVMAIFTPPNKRQNVKSALEAAGGQVLQAGIAEHGLIVSNV